MGGGRVEGGGGGGDSLHMREVRKITTTKFSDISIGIMFLKPISNAHHSCINKADVGVVCKMIDLVTRLSRNRTCTPG